MLSPFSDGLLTLSLLVLSIAQPALQTVNAPSNLEKRRGPWAQPPGLFHPESQHSLEQPAATGMSFSPYLLRSSTGLSASHEGDMNQRIDYPARLLRGHYRYPDSSSLFYLHPGGLNFQEIQAKPTAYPYYPCQANHRAGPPLEDGPPPPGLRRGLLKKEKDARLENCLKDSGNSEPNPITSSPSIQVFDRPFTHPSPWDPPAPLLPYPQSSAWAKMIASSRMHTQRSTLPYEPQAPSRRSPFESPHRPGRDRGKERLDEQGKDLSAAQHGPPAPSEHSPATTEPPMQGCRDPSAALHRSPAPPEHIPATILPPFLKERGPFSIPCRLPVPPEHSHAMTELLSLRDSNDPSATPYKQHVHPPALERKEPKRLMVHEERENQRTYSSFRNHGSELGSTAPHLPGTSDSRQKVGPSSNSAPLLDRGETVTTHSASVSTQNRPKHVARVRSINSDNSTVSSTNLPSRHPSLPGCSQTLATSSDKSPVIAHYVQIDC